jgi:glutamate racemase
MKIALVHATTTALNPIVKAFHDESNEVELLHYMDTGLLPMIEASGSLTPEIIRRFSLLVNLAVQSDVDCIQLSCSAFNNVTNILQPLYPIKLFRSDEAMLDEALAFERIGLISTVRETPIALMSYLREKNPSVQVESLVEPGLIHLLIQGNKEQHDEHVRNLIHQLEGKVDVIVLSQYSMEHVADQVHSTTPILTAPKASAKRCLSYLRTRSSVVSDIPK